MQEKVHLCTVLIHALGFDGYRIRNGGTLDIAGKIEFEYWTARDIESINLTAASLYTEFHCSRKICMQESI